MARKPRTTEKAATAPQTEKAEEVSSSPTPAKKPTPPPELGTINWGFGSAQNIASKDIVILATKLMTFVITLITFIFSGVLVYAGGELRSAGMAFLGAGITYWFQSKK